MIIRKYIYTLTSLLSLSLAAFADDASLLSPEITVQINDNKNICQSTTGDQALAACREAIRLIPVSRAKEFDLHKVHYNLGVELQRAGKIADSAGSYQKAIALDPAYADAHGNLGGVLFQMGKYEDALTAYSKAIELEPVGLATPHGISKKTSIYFGMAITLEKLGKYEEAIRVHHDDVLRVDPNFISSIFNIAFDYYTLKNYDKAVEWFENTVAKNPEYKSAHYHLGNLYSDRGQYDKAKPHLQMYLKIDPNNKKAIDMKELLAVGFYETGDKAQANIIFSEIISDKSCIAVPDTCYYLALSDLDAGNRSRAKERLQTSVFSFELYVRETDLDLEQLPAFKKRIDDAKKLLNGL